MAVRLLSAVLPFLLPCAAFAQAADPAAAIAPARVVAGQPVIVELAESVASKTHKRGDTFAIRLASPVVVGSTVLIPAGATGQGQVVDAASAGPLGRPAKLVLAARFIEVDGARMPLRAFHLGSAGADNSNTIMAASFVPYVGIFAGFIKGGEIVIPAGSMGQAKLGADFPAAAPAAPIQPLASVEPSAAPSPATPQ
jgi:hypothetical protein